MNPLTECPCGGELTVIGKTETKYELDGTEQYVDTEGFMLWCDSCDDWTEDDYPDVLTKEQVDATFARFHKGRKRQA